MTLRASSLPLSLDPLIAEAKRRARQRRFLAAAGASVVVALTAGLTLGLPPRGGGSSGGWGTPGGAGRLDIPKGTNGIAVILYGRLFATTKSGFDLRGLPVSAAALSPHAVNLAAGVGDSLVELAPSGRQVWSRQVGKRVGACGACGTVAAVAWSPDGSRIAYVVTTSSGYEVHVIRRNGTHDTVIDRDARPVQPSWRADSRALAYVGALGLRGYEASPIIYNLPHRSRHVIRWPIARSPGIYLAYAHQGNELAIRTETATLLLRGSDRLVWRRRTPGVGWPGGVSWLGGRLAVSGSRGDFTELYTVGHSGASRTRTIRVPAPILATQGREVALQSGTSVLVGPIGSLHRVLRFTPKPCYGSSCELPLGDNAISFG